MITYKNLRETVHFPINGQLVQMKRIKVLKVDGNFGYCPGDPNYSHRFRDPMFKQHMTSNARPALTTETMLPETQQVNRIRRLGQVVCDDSGRFYERVNGEFRPLNEVIIDGYNRLYEVVGEKLSSQPLPPSNHSLNSGIQTEARAQPERASTDENHPSTNNHRQPGRHVFAGYEKIFADPGLHIQVAFGSFMEELGIHLDQPEQYRPQDTLECYLQVYQLRRPVSRQHLAASELGDARCAWMFRPLTKEKAEALGVPELFIGEYVRADRAGNRLTAIGQRLYFIKPVSNPSVAIVKEDLENPEPNPQITENQDAAKRDHSKKGFRNLFKARAKN